MLISCSITLFLRPPSRRLSAFSSFFFQAEDGIRDIGVTGVQTCALPICAAAMRVGLSQHEDAAGEYWASRWPTRMAAARRGPHRCPELEILHPLGGQVLQLLPGTVGTSSRSEERRVGKECRARVSAKY